MKRIKTRIALTSGIVFLLMLFPVESIFASSETDYYVPRVALALANTIATSESVSEDNFNQILDFCEVAEKWRAHEFSKEEVGPAFVKMDEKLRRQLADKALRWIKSDDVRTSIAGIYLLCNAFGSDETTEYLESIVNRTAGWKDPAVVFVAANGLARIGNDSGTNILNKGLISRRLPDSFKQTALVSFKKLRIAPEENPFRVSLNATNQMTAFCAFDLAQSLDRTSDPMVVNTALLQLNRMSGQIESVEDFDWTGQNLLLKVSGCIGEAAKLNALTPEMRISAKKAVDLLMRLGTDQTKISIVYAYDYLADETMLETTSKMLSSSNSVIKANAAFALGTGTPDRVPLFARQLLPMLDSPDMLSRLFALFALRRGLGASVGTLVSDAEFSTLKKQVLESYAQLMNKSEPK